MCFTICQKEAHICIDFRQNSARVVGVLLVDIKLSVKASVPVYLQSRENTIFITFTPKTKAYKLMYQEVCITVYCFELAQSYFCPIEICTWFS